MNQELAQKMFHEVERGAEVLAVGVTENLAQEPIAAAIVEAGVGLEVLGSGGAAFVGMVAATGVVLASEQIGKTICHGVHALNKLDIKDWITHHPSPLSPPRFDAPKSPEGSTPSV